VNPVNRLFYSCPPDMPWPKFQATQSNGARSRSHSSELQRMRTSVVSVSVSCSWSLSALSWLLVFTRKRHCTDSFKHSFQRFHCELRARFRLI